MKTGTKIFVLLLLILLSTSPLGLAQNKEEFDIKIWPSKLEKDATPGTTQEFGINVQNLGAEDQTIKIYFNDYYINPDNTFIYKEPGQYSYSCATWLTTLSKKIDVETGETERAIFKLAVPRKAEPGGHYAIIFFEQVPKPGEALVKAQAVPRIGVVLLVTVPGEIVRKLEIKDVSVTSTWFWPSRKLPLLPRRETNARVVIYNPGNVHVTVKGKITYTPTFGWGAGTVDLGELTILPKTKRYLQAELPAPPLFGSYEVKAQVEYGPALDVFDTELNGKATFNSYPFALIIVIIILIALAITAFELFMWWRRKRKGEPGGDAKKEKKEDKKQKPGKKEKKKKKKEDLGPSEDSIEDEEEEEKEDKAEAPGDEPEAEDKEKQTAKPVNPLKDGWKKLTGMVLGQGLWAEKLRGRWQEKRFIKALDKEKTKDTLEDRNKKKMGGPDDEDFQQRSPLKLFDD